MKQTEARESVFQKYEKLGQKLKKIIYDQDDAIDEVIDAFIQMACKPVQAPPRAIFTFIGPPFVGKAYLARSLATLMPDYPVVPAVRHGTVHVSRGRGQTFRPDRL